MLSFVSELIQQLPPFVKELALLIVGAMCIIAALRGGKTRDGMMKVIT